ncbi:MAG: hypothetical protein M1294_11865 [Firmicutes bacterium]|nr:hypothetical protein [Bacillota bacterium]MCL5013877.1 hypothetical protein [Bacillota bacterium]
MTRHFFFVSGLISNMLAIAGCGIPSRISAPANNGRTTISRTANPSHAVSTHGPIHRSPSVGIMHLTMMSSHVGWVIGDSHQVVPTADGGRRIDLVYPLAWTI